MAAIGADLGAGACDARGTSEPLRPARRALREGRDRTPRVRGVRECALDRACLARARGRPGMGRSLVGPCGGTCVRPPAARSPIGCFRAQSHGRRRGSHVTLLRGYIVMAVFRGVALALTVIVTIYASIDLVSQLHDLGTGSYGFPQLLSYVLLRLPHKIFDTLPAAALIGSLLSLGNLAVHRELVVMRASGISSLQLLGTVGIAGITLAVLMALIGESVAPSLSGYASEMRQQAMRSDNGATTKGPATWLRDGDRILSVGRQTGELGYGGGVLLFELGPDHTLKEVARADSA